MDPNNIVYSIIIAFYQLCLKFKCFIRFHTHASAVNISNTIRSNCKQLEDLFNGLKLNLIESRLSYDYGLTIIWKICKLIDIFLIIKKKESFNLSKFHSTYL